jgi:hypothetical protein
MMISDQTVLILQVIVAVGFIVFLVGLWKYRARKRAYVIVVCVCGFTALLLRSRSEAIIVRNALAFQIDMIEGYVNREGIDFFDVFGEYWIKGVLNSPGLCDLQLERIRRITDEVWRKNLKSKESDDGNGKSDLTFNPRAKANSREELRRLWKLLAVIRNTTAKSCGIRKDVDH